MNTVYIEKRNRGFFGWLFLLIFYAWNGYMLFVLIRVVNAMNEIPAADSAAGQAGAAIGTGLGIGAILFVWMVGAVITGLFALLTRGSKTIVTKQ